ncbi:MAG TPA: hypothetical protein VGL56_07175 [Fimbriimonadaceae bacterium]|jgi:hypothetical protein
MSKAGWWILKWLIVPLGLLAVGFFVIGRNIGRNAKTVSVTTDSSNTSPSTDNSTTWDSGQSSANSDSAQPSSTPDNNTADNTDTNTVSTTHTPPLVTVTVKRGSSFRAGRYYADTTRRHSRHKKKKSSSDGTPAAPRSAPEIPMDNGDQGA